MKGIQTDCLTLLLLSNTVPKRWKSKFILPICIEAYAYDKKKQKTVLNTVGRQMVPVELFFECWILIILPYGPTNGMHAYHIHIMVLQEG